MSRQQRRRSLLGDAAAVFAAIPAFGLVVFLDSRPALTGPDQPWQALAGVWTLNTELSGAPGADGAGPLCEGQDAAQVAGEGRMGERGRGEPGGAGMFCDGAEGAETLRIEVDSPLVMIACGGSEVRSLYLGGPPVERQRGGFQETEIVSWAGNGLVVSATDPAGPTFAETFGIEGDGSGRLVRTLEIPDRLSGKGLTRRFVYDRTGDAPRSEVRPSMLAAMVVVALALVLAVERAIPGTDAS